MVKVLQWHTRDIAKLHPKARVMANVLCCRKADVGQEVVLTLAGPERSDYLNFVIKDESTGRWCAPSPSIYLSE